jgi:hypothetical protein
MKFWLRRLQLRTIAYSSLGSDAPVPAAFDYGPLILPLQAWRCVAANWRFGPKADMAILIGLAQTEPLPLARRTSLLSTEQ